MAKDYRDIASNCETFFSKMQKLVEFRPAYGILRRFMSTNAASKPGLSPVAKATGMAFVQKTTHP
jgi:hypothetical protein